MNPRPTAYESAEGGLQGVGGVSNECEIVGDSRGNDSRGSPDLAAVTNQFAASLLPRSARLSVSTATIYKLCAQGLLRHVRVLSAIRIPESALDAMSHEK